MLREFGYYGRMAWGMRELVRTLPPPDWEDQLRAQLRNRETIFLDTVRKVIFAKPEHPYNRMFQLAGCTYGDLANAVMRDGLEATLSALCKGGVYLAHDEFKGKTPIVRSGEHIRTSERSFLNPLATGLIETTSGGSRSPGTRTRQSTRDRLHREAYFRLRGREFELGDRAQIEVKPILPSGSGLLRCVRARALGYPIERWFTVGGAWGGGGPLPDHDARDGHTGELVRRRSALACLPSLERLLPRRPMGRETPRGGRLMHGGQFHQRRGARGGGGVRSGPRHQRNAFSGRG